MALEKDLNEMYDPEVQTLARHFGYSYDIVQQCFESSSMPVILNDSQYESIKAERSKLQKYALSLEKTAQAYSDLPDILKSVDELLNYDPNRIIGDLLKSSKDMEKILNRAFNNSTRAHGKNVYAEAIAEWLALIFKTLGKNITVGIEPISGNPSTEFCRCLEQAFQLFQVKGRKFGKEPHWRRYADDAKAKLEEQQNSKN